MSTIGPALSGMLAATARLEASAQRAAGVSPVGAAATTRSARPASQAAASPAPAATAAPKTPQSPGYFFAPDPDGPDPARERVEQMQALNQFKANLQSLLAGDRMTRATLEI